MVEIVAPIRKTRAETLTTQRGFISENWPLNVAASATLCTSQVLYANLVGVRAGDSISKVVVNATVAAASLTLAKVGLYSTSGTQLAASATNHTNFNGATGFIETSLSSAYTVPADAVIYACVLMVGTTPSTLNRGNGNANTWGAYGSNSSPYKSQTGQADLPSPATLTESGSSLPLWVGLA